MAKRYMVVALLGLGLAASCGASSVNYAKLKLAGTVAHVVTVNLHDPETRVTVAISKRGRGSAETFRSMMKRTRPTAAITGTFFDTRSLIPTGDIALFGTVVHSGCIGSALCIDSENRPSIVPLRTGRKSAWAGYETVLCAGPALVSKGRIAIALKHEGFRRSLLASARRTAVGITSSGKLVLVAINRSVSLYTIARALLQLKVTDALCLDGGSSTAFYHGNRYLAVPSRTLTNCLVVYSTSSNYAAARDSLVPAALMAKAQRRAAPTVAALTPTGLLPPGVAFPPILEPRQ